MSGSAQTLLDSIWGEFLSLEPLFATLAGDERFDDRLPDPSPHGLARRRTVHRAALESLDGLDRRIWCWRAWALLPVDRTRLGDAVGHGRAFHQAQHSFADRTSSYLVPPRAAKSACPPTILEPMGSDGAGEGATERRSAWTTTEPQTVTFVELFYDLVFVYAVTQITGLLHADLSLAGVGRSLIVLWLVWWAWTQFTWTLNPADTNHTAVRLLTLAATGAAFFMAQAIPDAYAGGGAWFAVPYAFVRLVGLGMQIEATWGTRMFGGAMTFVAPSIAGLGVVIAGSLLPHPTRELLWLGAIAIDIGAAAVAGERRWTIHAEHFTERHGLIVIIALGESLVAAGLAVEGVHRDGHFVFALVAAILLVSAAWWIYFGPTMETFRRALEESTAELRGGLARDLYSFAHLPIVAGIIAFAVAVEEVLAHPQESLEGPALAALAVGVALYVGGLAWAKQRATGTSPWVATVAFVAITAALVTVLPGAGSTTLGAVAAAFLALAAISSRAGT